MEYGLIGAKLGHSFSKEIHAQIADYDYELCELTLEGVDTLLRERKFRAINVTIPYKETVIPYLDVVSEDAQKIGAVNTIVNRDGRLYGYNTDYAGAAALIRHAGVNVTGKKALILGTGGTSKTLRTVVKDLGAAEIHIVSRHPKAEEISYAEAATIHKDAEIIVNTTPVGMYPNNFASAVSLEDFPNLSGVIDVVYNPLATQLVLDAQKRGVPAEGGLVMLAAQAVYASALFTGKKAEEALIERAYQTVLQEKRNLVLIGMPSCGKTTVGKMLAEKTGRSYLDTDEMIVNRESRSISDIFASDGEAAFRTMEREIISEAAKLSGTVIATGGGAAMDMKNIEALRQNGILIFLDRPLEALTATADRPLASDVEALKKRFAERYSTYCEVCNVRIVNDQTPEQAVKEILKATGGRV